MNPALRRALIAVLCLALGGCAARPVSRQAAHPVSSQPATETTAAAVPGYYAETTAALNPARSPANISVRDTDTGAIAATVRPPRPYQSFGYVFATDIPNTWVAGAQPWHPVQDDNSAQPVTLFEIRFNPATRQVETSRLPVPPILGTELVTVALSPDAAMLAEVTLTLGPVTGGTAQPRVSSRTLAESPNANYLTDYSLTWLGDGRTLAVGGTFGAVVPLRPAPAIIPRSRPATVTESSAAGRPPRR